MIYTIPAKYEHAVHVYATVNERKFYFFMHKHTAEPLGSSGEELWNTCCAEHTPQPISELLNDHAHAIALRILKGDKNIWPTQEQKADAKQRDEEWRYFRKMEPKINKLLKQAV